MSHACKNAGSDVPKIRLSDVLTQVEQSVVIVRCRPVFAQRLICLQCRKVMSPISRCKCRGHRMVVVKRIKDVGQ